jgi:putative RNA 2'-phosphotransferase
MEKIRRKKLSKLMSYILRHRPDEFGLVLDKEGFVDLKELHKAIVEEKGWSFVRRHHIEDVVITCDKQRFEIREGSIRAHYGHSVPVRITYEPAEPPKILFHGTRRRTYPVILSKGLKPMGRQYVHLTTSEELALRIGRRRDPEPVLLEIQAKRAYDNGIVFYRTNELIYLVDYVPVEYITGPSVKKLGIEGPKERRQKEEVRELPGSFFLDLTKDPFQDKMGKDSIRKARRFKQKRRWTR